MQQVCNLHELISAPQAIDELLQLVACQHAFQAKDCEADPVVCHPIVLVVVCADALGAVGGADQATPLLLLLQLLARPAHLSKLLQGLDAFVS